MFIARRLLVLGIFIVLVPFAKDLYSILAAPLLEKTSPGRRFNSDWRFIAVYCADDYLFFLPPF